MLIWQDWRYHPQAFASPYVEWFHDLHIYRAGDKPDFVSQIVPRGENDFRSLDLSMQVIGPDPVIPKTPEERAMLPYLIMSPKYLTNEHFAEWWTRVPGRETWLPPADEFDYPTVEEDTLVLGIIDVGFAPGHRRFRRPDGTTRILGMWNQGARVPRQHSGYPEIPHLPFGAHLFEREMNAALCEHSAGNDPRAALDQQSFNRATGLIDFETVEADRLLALRASHGAHVMGLAGGADPADPAQMDFARRVRFLLVCLPPPFAHGDGGTFLDYYLIYALRWIIEANARIAEKSNLKSPRPLITNISFGKHAGAGDASQPFVKAILDKKHGRDGGGLDDVADPAAFHAVLPAGNSNLDRGHARLKLEGGKEATLDWIVQPDDETSNFLEIWCVAPSKGAKGKAPLAIELVPPGQSGKGTSNCKPGQVSDLEQVGTDIKRVLARIYCEEIAIPSTEDEMQYRFRYLVCMAPDRYRNNSGHLTPPSGRWTLRVKNRTQRKISVTALIQTDQSTLPGQPNARQSYLDDPTYSRFLDSGRVRDSYEYAYDPARHPKHGKPENLDRADFVKRHGTLNSYASNSVVATVGGYRASDGRPAPYSSTGLGKKKNKYGRGAPTAAIQTDDGYAHHGILADGSSDGSVVAMRGTSFASALAARLVLDAWIAGDYDGGGGNTIKKILYDLAKEQHPPPGWFDHPTDIEKTGRGRILARRPGPIRRL